MITVRETTTVLNQKLMLMFNSKGIEIKKFLLWIIANIIHLALLRIKIATVIRWIIAIIHLALLKTKTATIQKVVITTLLLLKVQETTTTAGKSKSSRNFPRLVNRMIKEATVAIGMSRFYSSSYGSDSSSQAAEAYHIKADAIIDLPHPVALMLV